MTRRLLSHRGAKISLDAVADSKRGGGAIGLCNICSTIPLFSYTAYTLLAVLVCIQGRQVSCVSIHDIMRNKKGQHHAFTSVILSTKFTSCFLASGGFSPRPPPGLRSWTPLWDFRPTDPLNFAPSPTSDSWRHH